MNVMHDIILSLQETPFLNRSEDEKQEILQIGRPTPHISSLKKDRKDGRAYVRTFQVSWYETYSWVCGSTYKQRLYCWPCLLLMNTKNIWISEGYKDMKNFCRAVKVHDSSKDHIQSSLVFVRLCQNMSKIEDAPEEDAQFSTEADMEDVRKHRLLINYFIGTTFLLRKQELAPIRNKYQLSSDTSNFQEILNLSIKHSGEIVTHLNLSKDLTSYPQRVQDDSIFCIEACMKETITEEISKATYFSVIMDDARDIGDNAKCSVTIRFSDKAGKIKQRFLGFFYVSIHSRASDLYDLLVSILEPFKFRDKLVALSYQGATIMTGELNSLQHQIKVDAPRVLYTHCPANRINLILQQSCSDITECRIFFATLKGLSNFFRKAYKNTLVFEKVLKARGPLANDTGWYSSTKILYFIAKNWENIKSFFKDLITNPEIDSDIIYIAKGFLKQFSDFRLAFLTLLFKNIFTITNGLFRTFQVGKLDIDFCIKQMNIVLKRLKKVRGDQSFQSIIKDAHTFTGLPADTTVSEKYKLLFHEIVDCMISQIDARFENLNELQFIGLLDNSQFKNFGEEFPSRLLNSLESSYPKTFEKERLKNELSTIYKDPEFQNTNILENLALLKKSGLRPIFSEVYKLATLILTLPFKAIQNEKDLSHLKKIGIYLRKGNSILQDKFSALSLMSLEEELITESWKNNGQFNDLIIEEFAARRGIKI